jgi:hypothetical protein
LAQTLETVQESGGTLLSTLQESSAPESSGRRGHLFAAACLLLFRRSQTNSNLQRKVSLYLLFKRCPKAVFLLLNRCGICLSYEGSLAALKESSSSALGNLDKWAIDHARFLAVFDNINFTIKVSEETLSSRNRMVHATIGFLGKFRVPNPIPQSEENLLPQRTPMQLPGSFIYHNEEERGLINDTLTILFGRVLAGNLPSLSRFLKKPLSHPYSEWTCKITEEFGTEILFLDENKSEDVPAILDYFAV